MQKCLIFLLAFISLSVQAQSIWNPYNMNRERFVHLNDADKRKVIISTMELMVELEAKYKKESSTSSFSSERFLKYVQLIQKLQNLLISTSYAAAGDKNLPQLAGDFSNLLESLGTDGCIYGGYVSKMGVSNGIKYCRHPSTMKSTIKSEAAIKNAYLSKGKSCVGPHKISCNPVIFGYEKSGGTDPFCVETGYLKSGKPHNVSYACMKKALEETPDKEARLKVLSDAMAVTENKEAFNKVHKFIFRTCACGDSTINQDYAAYIRPHRTCYGMMNTLRVIKNSECEQVNNIRPTEFADEWARYFGKESVFPDIKPEKNGDFDKTYESLIDNASVQAICDGKPVETPPPVEEKEEGPKSEWLCETKCSEQELKEGDKAKKILCKIEKAGWNTINAGQTEPEFKDESKELKSLEQVIENAEVKTILVEMKDGTKQECPVTLETAIEDKTCTIAIAEDNSKATVSFQGPEDQVVSEYNWKGGTATKELPTEISVTQTDKEQEVSVEFYVKNSKGVISEMKSCTATIPKLSQPEQSTHTIKAEAETLKTPQDVTVKVKATVDGSDIVPEGFYISWTRKGDGVIKLKPVAKTKVDTKTTAIQDTPPADEAEKVETPKDVSVIGEVSTGNSISELRVDTKYETCASLIEKSSGTSKAGPSCVTIPALTATTAPPVYSNPYQNMPPPNFTAPVNNTRQMGVQ